MSGTPTTVPRLRDGVVWCVLKWFMRSAVANRWRALQPLVTDCRGIWSFSGAVRSSE